MPDKLRIHMLSGNDEYRAEASLDKLAAHLTHLGVAQCSMSRGRDKGEDLPDLDRLDAADLLLVFCKRITVPDDQLAVLKAWCAAGRPVVGIRTASHAFQNWLEFDRDVLGGDYNGHGGDETVTITAEPGAEADAILDGVEPWSRHDKVYRNPHVAPDVAVLLRAADGEEAGQPVAWRRAHPASNGRAFYTSMGHPQDFDDPRYLRLISNAVRWAGGQI